MRWLPFVVALAVTGCSVTDEPNLGTPPTTTTTVATTSTSTTTTLPPSVGLVRIGPSAYDLTFTCIAPGAGEILAVGLGTDVNGRRVESYVQAYVGEPFVGVVVGEGDNAVRFEPRIDRRLEFDLVDDVLRFDDVDFVSDLDLETGEFTPAGVGSVVVECRSYEEELPPSLFS